MTERETLLKEKRKVEKMINQHNREYNETGDTNLFWILDELESILLDIEKELREL